MDRRLGWRWAAAATLVITLAARVAVADERRWDQLTPSPPPAGAIGGHASGCLAGAEPLPLDGLGYQVMRPSRKRYYGHPTTIELVRELAGVMHASGRGPLLVGDLAQPRGGPMLSGHRSHQTGLDVDIWFVAGPAWTMSFEEREGMSPISMVDRQGIEVDPTIWTAEHVDLLRIAADFPQVDRIFVNAAIKQQLCRTVGEDRSWLAKIRPWWGHDQHFHVRLRCPADSIECLDQQPSVPAGDGCDETLAWWFSEDAEEELRKLQAKPARPMTLDDLPSGCRVVLTGSDAEFGPESDDHR